MNIPTVILKGILRLLGMLPLKVHYVLSGFLAFLVEKIIRYRVSDVTINLARSFPQLKYEDISTIRHNFYRHFCDVFVEAIWFGGSHNPKRLIKQKICTIVNPEVLNHFAETSKSAIILSSHSGNWELSGGIISYSPDQPLKFQENSVCVIYKALSSKVWDNVMRDNRRAPLNDRKNYNGYLESGQAMRYIYKHRHELNFYNFINDQSPYQNSGGRIDITFMGQSTKAMSGAATLASRFGMPVIYQKMSRNGRGHYLIEYSVICENAAEMSVEEIIREYYRLLEKDLREQPENYLWTHRRWK